MKQIENYHKAPSEAEKAMIVTDPLKIFHGAVENCKPLLTLKTIEKGGSRYRVRGIIHCKHNVFMVRLYCSPYAYLLNYNKSILTIHALGKKMII